MSTDPLLDLLALSETRWTLSLLADLAVHGGARFVELVNRLGIARESLARTIAAADAVGLVMRNPGHGHPLRPEYLLTPKGQALAARALEIETARARIALPPAALTRWSLPALHAIHTGHCRFNAIARLLPPASPRALSQSLRSLTSHELVRRDLVEGYPPRSEYALTGRGASLMAVG